MQSEAMVVMVKDALKDLKARDIRVLNVSKLTKITEFMILASGTSGRHVRSIADQVIEKAKSEGRVPIGVEGHELGEWVLVDLDDVVVHIMRPKVRDFYKLENLWDMEEHSSPATKPTRAEPAR